jgi:RNA polymerase sigma-70 factor (ECF subfamily)
MNNQYDNQKGKPMKNYTYDNVQQVDNVQQEQINEDLKWVTDTKQGDAGAFTCIIEKYQRPVYNLCYYMLKNAVEAEDAAQEVFLRAYAKLDSYDEQRKFSSWLFSIASHYCLDQLKRPRCNLTPLDDLLAEYYLSGNPAAQPEAILLSNETAAEVRRLLDVLPPHYRAAVILKYWQAMSYQEIAHTLNTTVSTIRSNLFQARRKMAKTVKQQDRLIQPDGVYSFGV